MTGPGVPGAVVTELRRGGETVTGAVFMKTARVNRLTLEHVIQEFHVGSAGYCFLFSFCLKSIFR